MHNDSYDLEDCEDEMGYYMLSITFPVKTLRPVHSSSQWWMRCYYLSLLLLLTRHKAAFTK